MASTQQPQPAPARISLAAKYGGLRGGRVAYEAAVRYGADDLIVGPDDDLYDIDRKMGNAHEIVTNGGSLAVAIDLLPADGSMPTGAPKAREGMSPEEKDQFDDWLADGVMPPIDVMKDRAAPEGGESKKNRDLRRLEGFRRIYDDHNLTRENLAWFYKNHPYLIPLITAAEKMIGMERALTNSGQRDPRDLAELQAANKLIATAASRQAAILEEVNRLKRGIAFKLGAVQARRVHMQPEPEEGKRKPLVRYDEIRKARGMDPVGAPKVWNKEGAMGRVQQLAEGLAQAPSRKRARVDDGGGRPAGGMRNPFTRMSQGGETGVGGSRSRRRATPLREASAGLESVGTPNSPRYAPESPREGPPLPYGDVEGMEV